MSGPGNIGADRVVPMIFQAIQKEAGTAADIEDTKRARSDQLQVPHHADGQAGFYLQEFRPARIRILMAQRREVFICGAASILSVSVLIKRRRVSKRDALEIRENMEARLGGLSSWGGARSARRMILGRARGTTEKD